MYNMGLYRESMKNNFLSKPQGLEPKYLVCCFTCWTSTKLVPIMPMVFKMALKGGSYALHRLIYGRHKTLFLSEITEPKALIFCMQHHLLYIYSVCSIFALSAKNSPTQGVQYFM